MFVCTLACLDAKQISSILLKYIHLSVHQISPKPLQLQSRNSHIVYALPRQRRHSFQNKFYCPFDQFYLRQFKRIGTPSTPNIAQINNLVLLSDRSLCIILFAPLIRISAVAQWLVCATENGVFTGSNLAEVVWNLFSISFTPLNFASVFRKRLYRSCDVQLSAMF